MSKNITNLFYLLIAGMVLLTGCKKENEIKYSADKKLAEKISDADSFEDIFRLETEIQLSGKEGYYITGLRDLLIGKGKDFIIYDSGPKSNLVVFDSSGNFKQIVGNQGDGPGEYKNIQSITMNSKGEILLFDFFGFKVSIFDSSYNFIKLLRPKSIFRALHAYGKNKLFLHETIPFTFRKSRNQNAVILIDYNGDTIKSFAPRNPELNKLDFSPNNIGIAFDKQEHIYEMNPLIYEVRKFDFDGNLIAKLGDGKTKYQEIDNGDGNKYQVPVLYNGPYVFDSKIVMVETDKGLDFYDDEGRLIKKGIKFDKHICTVINNKLYIVDSSDGEKNPKILIYTFK